MESRIIKFRGQRVSDKQWVYGYYILDGNTHRIYEIDKPSLTPTGVYSGVEVIPETVGQFTGKKDKEGTDVYEGDILDFDANEWGKEGFVSQVSYDTDEAEFSFGGGLPYDLAEWRKVIGNVHDNPELLHP